MRIFIPALALGLSIVSLPVGAEAPKPATPNDIVAAAPAKDWVRIAPSDLMVMDLAPGASGKARRVVIQLMPAPFSQGWIGNIRKLVAARWFDGIAVVRAQDYYVVQWGDPDGETPGKAKALPKNLRVISQSEYQVRLSRDPQDWRSADDTWAKIAANIYALQQVTKGFETSNNVGPDSYAKGAIVTHGWPVATNGSAYWPVHCYGMVGVGRNLSPDTGTGAELYTVIGQAPRQLDRNIALVGRIIAGMENLSSLPRGTGELGFYKTPKERTPIIAVRLGSDVAGLPAYEYLSTESGSFEAYVDKRANRKDDFYIQPAGGVDVCNVPVPIREAKH
jgi:peptidylprolyl isomerase